MSHRNLSQFTPTTPSLLQLPAGSVTRTIRVLAPTRDTLESLLSLKPLSSSLSHAPLVLSFPTWSIKLKFSFPHLPICPLNHTTVKIQIRASQPSGTPRIWRLKSKLPCLPQQGSEALSLLFPLLALLLCCVQHWPHHTVVGCAVPAARPYSPGPS